MQEKLTNEQVDVLLKRLIDDAAASETTIEEAANSPSVWWSVQRQIRQQQPEVRSPWPPIAKVWRWGLVGLPVATAAALLINFYGPSQTGPPVMSPAEQATNYEMQPDVPDQGAVFAIDRDSEVPDETAKAAKVPVRKLRHGGAAKKNNNQPRLKLDRAEIRSDFIALSYARDPDSGQIVRVKVPSSMLVTMGLVASVEKPSALVDAEILVGDDGLSRAIRFIR